VTRTRSRTTLTVLALATLGVTLVAASPTVQAAPVAGAADSSAGGQAAAGLPASFHWRSTGALISPKADASHPIVSVKDPTVVRYKGQWLVYATTANTSGNWSLEYSTFRDWSHAGAAPQYFLDQTAIGPGYRAAPQLFYFAPQKLWYLVYQTGNASYSTTTDPTKPETWSAPKNFYSSMPEIIAQNIGNGFWVDMWVICDEVNCYLFSSDDNGHLYRSQTTVADFPNGFDKSTVIALQDPNRFSLFEASNVYRVKGTNSYLLLVEAIGSDGRRYFRSWTSSRLDGAWTPLADTEDNPFARASNVAFKGTAWTQDISHGEMIRDGYDQTLTIDPHHLQYLYQGMDPSAGGDYSQLPWRLGLLTQTRAED
jgi:endo-1,4-beta-xylanase